MKTKITLLLLFFSISTWSQTSSGSGTSTSGTGAGTGIKVTISSREYSNTIEILPEFIDAKVIGYKIYDSDLELKKEATIAPTNRETISVNDMESDHYYIQLLLDKEENNTTIISKQFIKE